MERVLITGATGFIGNHLIERLLKKKYKLTVVIRNKNKAQQHHWYEKVDKIILDIHTENLNKLSFNCNSLIHLAWKGLPNYNNLHHFEENLPYSFKFIKHALDCGIKKVLVTGTCFEYGLKNGEMCANDLTEPNNAYSLAKDTLRKQLELLKLHIDFKLQWLRLFYIYGKGQHSKSFFQLLNKALEANEENFKMSPGNQIRDYLPVEDACNQITEIYEKDKEGIFNVCSGKPISLKDFAKKIISNTDKKINLNLGYFPYSKHEPMSFWGKKN